MTLADLIRPELRAGLRRWREALTGGAVMLLALWAWTQGIGIVAWLAVPLGLAGAALVSTGVVRGQLRGPGTGPGVVDMTEGQLAYFGPRDGGVVALDAVQAIAIDRTGKPAHWIVERAGEPPLHIPVTAKGADTLLDAFAALPGFRMDRAVHPRGSAGTGPRVIWRRAPVAPLGPARRVTDLTGRGRRH